MRGKCKGSLKAARVQRVQRVQKVQRVGQRLDATVFLTDRKLFAKGFLSDMTLRCFTPTGNYLHTKIPPGMSFFYPAGMFYFLSSTKICWAAL